ncbi:nicotinamide mononucleotide transporter family protein [Streptomyces sp. Je 1-4]|uniref:nicotinamide mononucleotide transporter family protein n=1 Tax=Streptomyces TaxID=1883 RepID=UPI00140EF331|nr:MULTISPECIES: nicotinamide mononucleotide transporter family protein [unclassified Streptomyces]QIK09854.1 nicotinamide mononucleotide transporter [Streptomyces sp. ID38640]UYB43572.1 nicotinamide mononucleotide transporter family protein [Streptomyces sp. Je 1-4]UZQ39960.1 nicotinamide mononucleotide transporter family protein [Streptomyces sp. Je 1-4] [Streptomyces sp. Je 1-4 4N24]UZQ47377.1 nicotinamide mononucleotide transporter family protein [Streptomyces sp. Je 1-4] [Streptomyces sp. 
MSVLDTLNGEAFTALGQHVIWSDMIGNTIGLAALALGWRRSIWTWPAQFLSGAVLVAAYASAHLSGGVGKQLLVIGVALWGWRQWQRGRQQAQDGSIAVRFAGWRERGLLLGGTAVGTAAVGTLFTLIPQLSWNPWPDAYIFVGTLTAMVAQARGLVEFWFAWLLVDVVGVPLAFSSGLAFSGLVYVVYLALVVWGLRDWWLRSRASGHPVLEGAAA